MCRKLPSCYVTNPATPYGIILLPKSPNENTSSYSSWGASFGQTINDTYMSSVYRLDATETIVMLGQTSPRSLYFSYVPYLFDRWYPYQWYSHNVQWNSCPNVTNLEGSRCKLFASLGNPINIVNMNTSQKNGQSFNSAFAYYFGGDQNQVNRIQSRSVDAGIPTSIHNAFGISTQRVRFGFNKTSDGFTHITRTAFIEDENEFKNYIHNPEKFITVLRITPGNTTNLTTLPFPTEPFKKRISEQESVSSEGLTNKKLISFLENDVRFSIIDKFKRTHPFVYQFALQSPILQNGYDCIDHDVQCYGEIHDTSYPNSWRSTETSRSCMQKLHKNCPIPYRTTLQEDGSDFFILTGVNHNATKRTLYSSITAYTLPPKTHPLGSFNSHFSPNSYKGSANQYLKQSDISEYFFAVKISRKCEKDEKFCLVISKSDQGSLRLNESVVFVERNYLDHMTAGPANGALVNPIAYHFSSKYLEGK